MHMQADGDGAAWTGRFRGKLVLVWLSEPLRYVPREYRRLHMCAGSPWLWGIVLDNRVGVWEA